MKNIPYDISKFVSWLFFGIGYGLEVRGQEHVPRRGPFIAAANHASFFDPPVLGASCPRRVRFMARADLYAQPILSAYMHSVRCISVRRDEADLGAIRKAAAALKQGEVVAIFPEGGRQLGGVNDAKRGVGLLATIAKVPIVPVFIEGTAQAWSKGAKGLSPSKIRVAFGPPIPYTNAALGTVDRPSRDRHEQLADEVTRAWQRLAQQVNG